MRQERTARTAPRVLARIASGGCGRRRSRRVPSRLARHAGSAAAGHRASRRPMIAVANGTGSDGLGRPPRHGSWAKVSAALLHSIKLPVAGAPDTRPFPRNWNTDIARPHVRVHDLPNELIAATGRKPD